MITKFGKRFLANFVAGNSSFASKEMALGIATGSALEYPLSDTNSRLGLMDSFVFPLDKSFLFQ